MTDAKRGGDPCDAVAGLEPGCGVVFRHYAAPDRCALARTLASACRRRGLVLLVAEDPGLARSVGADGLHLPERALRRNAVKVRRWARDGGALTAAVHSLGGVHLAAEAGCRAILVSPVYATPSHPDARPLGPLRFLRLARAARRRGLLVYALGGLSARSARRFRPAGVTGYAGISALARRA